MREGFWSWIRGKQGAAQSVQPHATPSLESLEPRLLLNADFVGIEPLRTLDVQPCEQVIQVDLDHQNETTQDADPSLILTYLASSEEPQEAVASPSDGEQDTETTVESLGILGDSVVEESIPSESLRQAELGDEIAIDSEESAAPLHEQTACLIPMDGQDDISETDGFPIEARGPPAGSCDALSPLFATTYRQEGQPCALAQVESVSASHGTKAPELPGLVLVDPDISNWQGQIIYLDFDGEQDVVYNGPVTIGPFDIPAFQAPGELAGQEGEIMAAVTASLNDLFAETGVLFTLDRPQEPGSYSKIYVDGDGSWASAYGPFFGLAEQVDIGNQDLGDNAYVFTERLASPASCATIYADALADLIAHEVGHLIAYQHDVQYSAGELGEVAQIVNPFDFITERDGFSGIIGGAVKKLMERVGAGLTKGASIAFTTIQNLMKNLGGVDVQSASLTEVSIHIGASAGINVGDVVQVDLVSFNKGFAFTYDATGEYWTVARGVSLEVAQSYDIVAEEFASFRASGIDVGVRFSADKKVPLIPLSFGGEALVSGSIDPDVNVDKQQWTLTVSQTLSFADFVAATGKKDLDEAIQHLFTPRGDKWWERLLRNVPIPVVAGLDLLGLADFNRSPVQLLNNEDVPVVVEK